MRKFVCFVSTMLSNVKLFLILTLTILPTSLAQHEDIPYENVAKICDTCVCMTAQDADKKYHHLLDCSVKNFSHILARWPTEFGSNHNGVEVIATFSGNEIALLQQFPATNGSLSFSCRHCGIKDIQAPTFMDAPNIIRLDLSWNELTTDALTADVFRGPYKNTGYEPIALSDLDLSHNKISSLEKLIFEHTPNLVKLNLGYNSFKELDTATAIAISSTVSLELLDLSHNGLDELPSLFLKTLINLKTLLLNGNQLTTIPSDIKLIGQTLEFLNFAENPVKGLSETNFNGLKVLKRLNISSMNELTTIENRTFTHLESLEYLMCSRNPQLGSFDIDGLLHCRNLTYLDVSDCKLETVNINVDLSTPLPRNLIAQWPRLHTLLVAGNPWTCDCKLMRILEFCGSDVFKTDQFARCHLPFGLSGTKIGNLTSEYVCDLPKELIVPDNDEPPKFLRRRYIVLTIVTILIVLIIGLLIGFLTVCIRRRLKRDDYGVAPIRYTSVRSSNLSAISVVK